MGVEERERAVKAVHLALRQVHQSPEVRAARRLAASLPAPSDDGGPRVLIMSMRDWAIHVHFEAVLGHALQLRGATVRHLTCGGGLAFCDRANSWESPPMPCSSCSRYSLASLKAHGRDPLRLFDGAPDNSRAPELDALAFDELRSVEYRGIPIGRLMEIPVKWFLLADTIGDDPLGPSTYRGFLRSAMSVVDRTWSVLDSYRPDRVLMLNGLFSFEAIMREMCRQRDIPVVTYERAHVIDAYHFALGVPAGRADLDAVWPFWSERPLTESESAELDDYVEDRRYGRRAADVYWRDAVFSGLEERRAGKRAILFTNLVWDSAVLDRHLAFDSLIDWAAATVEFFKDRPSDELLIRVHPAEVKLSGRQSRETLQRAFADRGVDVPANVTIIPPDDPRSTYSLLEGVDLGLAYSSTVGLEMALTGRPVIVAAKTHYRGKGFTLDASTRDHYVSLLTEQLDATEPWQPDHELARRYAYLFFLRAPYTELGVREHIRGLVTLTARDASGLLPGVSPDLDRFCDRLLRAEEFGPVPVAAE